MSGGEGGRRRGSAKSLKLSIRRTHGEASGIESDPASSRGCPATAVRLSQTVIAGLVPAIHASNWLLISLERFGAAAEWALGTSPRVTSGVGGGGCAIAAGDVRSEEHTSELQSLMRISYAAFCLNKKNTVNSPDT